MWNPIEENGAGEGPDVGYKLSLGTRQATCGPKQQETQCCV